MSLWTMRGPVTRFGPFCGVRPRLRPNVQCAASGGGAGRADGRGPVTRRRSRVAATGLPPAATRLTSGAQPAQGVQPQGYGHGGGQPPPYGTPGTGGFPPPQPGTPAPRKRTELIAVAAVLALAVIGGGVWFAVGRGSDSGSDDAKSPTSVGTPGATGSAGSTEETPEATDPADPTADPSDEPSASPPARSDNPLVPQPTGTGLQAVWKGSDSTMLVLGDEYADQPTRVNAVFTDSDGFECKGRWQKDESGDFLKGATGAETFERFQDMDPA